MNRLQITSALVKAGWSKSDIDGLYDSGYSDEEIMEQAGLKDTKTAMTQVNDYAHDDSDDVGTEIAEGDFDFTPDSIYVQLSNRERQNAHRKNGIIDRAIDEFLRERLEKAESFGIDVFNMSAEEIEDDLLGRIETLMDLENVDRPKGRKFTKADIPETLTAHIVARIILATGRIANIRVAGGQLLPAYYYASGRFEGTWRMDLDKDGEEHQTLKRLVKKLNPSMKKAEVENVVDEIFTNAPNRTETVNRNLVAVNNGVWNRKAKTFTRWGDDSLKGYTFTKKIPHNYVPHAPAPVFNDYDNTDWDFDKWLLDLMNGNKDAVTNMWEVFADCVMPYAFTERRAVFFIDGSSGGGSNGKGSLCDFISVLCGGEDNASRTVISLSLKKWSDRFALAGLPLATVSIADENGVGLYIDDIENLKAAITCDRVTCEPKFGGLYVYTPYLVPIFCMNNYPKVKDPSGSWLRRLFIIQFCKRFVGVDNKTYIKCDYLHREALMEYVLSKVLEEYSDIDRFTMYPYQQENLVRYQDQTDSAFRFMEEHYEQFVWDVLPFNFLYLMYSQWYLMSYNKRTTTSLDKFKDSVVAWCDNHKDAWTCDNDVDKNNYNKMVFSSPSKAEKESMTLEENLIAEYKLFDADMKHSYVFDNTKHTINSLRVIPAKVSGIHRVKGGTKQ